MELLIPNYYVDHILRMPPDQWPDPANRGFAKINPDVYVLMQGPSEMGASGRLEQWDRTADLPRSTVLQPIEPTMAWGYDAQHLRLRIQEDCGFDALYRNDYADRQIIDTALAEGRIILTRDRKISDIEAQIRASQETLTSLRASLSRLQAQAAEEKRTGPQVTPQTAKTLANNEAQIAKHEAYVQKLKKEQEAARIQYQTELENFRELKRKPASAQPAAASPVQKK